MMKAFRRLKRIAKAGGQAQLLLYDRAYNLIIEYPDETRTHQANTSLPKLLKNWRREEKKQRKKLKHKKV